MQHYDLLMKTKMKREALHKKLSLVFIKRSLMKKDRGLETLVNNYLKLWNKEITSEKNLRKWQQSKKKQKLIYLG